MKEDFLHYIWQSKLVAVKNLLTTDLEIVEIKSQGIANYNTGPDFLNAKIKIGNQLWAGNVELHVKASDWYVHHHETDSNYDAVILHVVWINDVQIFRKDNTAIPTLVLKDYVLPTVLDNYKQLFLKSQRWINCENQIAETDKFLLNNWLERLFIERLESKSQLILELLKSSNNDWEAVLFILLAKNFGLKVNGDAFLNVAQSLDFNSVRKIRGNQKELEALFFGQAGLLEDKEEEAYFLEQKAIYNYQKKKFKLKTINKGTIQFFRLRPLNFPTIRWAQLAALYHKHHNLFSKIITSKTTSSLYKIFDIVIADFWQRHYTFTATSAPKRNKNLSKSFIDLIIINTIIPLQFVYQKQIGKLEADALMLFMQELKPENNSIIKKFDTLKVKAKNAFETQALLQLKNEYCDKNKCLECKIGNSILSK